mmetsp:Transcript_26401/g.88445  ORF Transcript_26401/g.88445 Transcript_26401/m.88445 type:complete len:238 (-) Transcript_26401:337-1050(-)
MTSCARTKSTTEAWVHGWRPVATLSENWRKPRTNTSTTRMARASRSAALRARSWKRRKSTRRMNGRKSTRKASTGLRARHTQAASLRGSGPLDTTTGSSTLKVTGTSTLSRHWTTGTRPSSLYSRNGISLASLLKGMSMTSSAERMSRRARSLGAWRCTARHPCAPSLRALSPTGRRSRSNGKKPALPGARSLSATTSSQATMPVSLWKATHFHMGCTSPSVGAWLMQGSAMLMGKE